MKRPREEEELQEEKEGNNKRSSSKSKSSSSAAAAAASSSSSSSSRGGKGSSSSTNTSTTSGGGSGGSSAVDISRHGGGGGGRPCPRLYVGNLHRSVREGDILRLFLPHGKVVKEDFCWHTAGPKKGEPRGYAFVEYETTAEAARAVAALDGKLLMGRRLNVRYVREQEVQPSDPRSFVARKAGAKGGHRPGTGAAFDSSGGGGGGGGAASASAGGGGGGRKEASEESALEAKIRALKAMLQQPPRR